MQQNQSSLITAKFLRDDEPITADLDAVTVDIERDDGTQIVTAGVANPVEDQPGVYSYLLTAADTALLDDLTVHWSGTVSGLAEAATTYVEVAGGVIFTVEQARTIDPLQNTEKYPTATIRAYRSLVEDALEDWCGCAFVPRYARELVSGAFAREVPDAYASYVMLHKPLVSRVRHLGIDGEEMQDFSDVMALPTGALFRTSGWPIGVANIDVAYEHGWLEPPQRITQAALTLAKHWIVKGPLDDRITAMTTDQGTFPMLTPGVRGSHSGLPDVDEAISQYRYLK